MEDRHQKAPYPLRISNELRKRLEESAKDGARSLNAEITARLEKSFDQEKLITIQKFTLTQADTEELARRLSDLLKRNGIE